MTQPQDPASRTAAAEGADVIVLPPVLYLGSTLAGVLLGWLWPLGFAAGSSARIVLGLGAIGVAGGIILAAFRLFGTTGQDPNPRTPTPEIVRDGVYRFTRNPMYVALSLLQTGIGVALGNAWILLLLLPALVVMHYGVVLREEAYLERKFGTGYLEWKASVRRWL